MVSEKKIRTVIFNQSGVYDDEGLLDGKSPWEDSEIVDFSSLDGTVGYCDPSAAEQIRSRLSSLNLSSKDPSIAWIDSGDYHYMTLFRTENFSLPFQLLLIDRHPDMQEAAFGGDMISCGGWLRLLLKNNPNLFRVSILGMNSSLLKETNGYNGIVYTNLKLTSSLPVFISIDKDALSQDYSRTNWDQGEMTLSDLKEILRNVISQHRILGVDICGERPSSKGGDGSDMLLNGKTNAEIQKLLKELL